MVPTVFVVALDDVSDAACLLAGALGLAFRAVFNFVCCICGFEV